MGMLKALGPVVLAAVAVMGACSGDLEFEHSGRTCTSRTDCGAGEVCAFPMRDGCSAKGECIVPSRDSTLCKHEWFTVDYPTRPKTLRPATPARAEGDACSCFDEDNFRWLEECFPPGYVPAPVKSLRMGATCAVDAGPDAGVDRANDASEDAAEDAAADASGD